MDKEFAEEFGLEINEQPPNLQVKKSTTINSKDQEATKAKFTKIFTKSKKTSSVSEGKIEELGKQIAGFADKFKEGKDDVMMR